MVALHWALSQFHGSMEVAPRRDAERIYAVSALIIGMVGFSTFVSLLTGNVVSTLHQHRQRSEFMQRLREYFLRHQIPGEVMMSVKRYLESIHVWEEKAAFNEFELLRPLPTQMQKSLQLEARIPAVGKHHLVVWLLAEHPTVLRDLTHSAFTVSYR